MYYKYVYPIRKGGTEHPVMIHVGLKPAVVRLFIAVVFQIPNLYHAKFSCVLNKPSHTHLQAYQCRSIYYFLSSNNKDGMYINDS